jgi:hypothetical protein
MSTGTGPQAVIRLLEREWEAKRPGRADLPPMIDATTGSDDPDLNRGVLVVRDRQRQGVDRGLHDIIHVYQPSAASPTITDRGFKEVNEVETVQIDIELADRTDHATATDARLDADERLLGRRTYTATSGGTLGTTSGFTLGDDGGATAGVVNDPLPSDYRGILGEVRYILETVRRGYKEWDTVSHTLGNLQVFNSTADASVTVELERIARNTVQ